MEQQNRDLKHYSPGPTIKPTIQYEQTRRQIIDGIKEMWYFFGSALKNMRTMASKPNITNTSEIMISINHTLTTGVDHKRWNIAHPKKYAKRVYLF